MHSSYLVICSGCDDSSFREEFNDRSDADECFDYYVTSDRVVSAVLYGWTESNDLDRLRAWKTKMRVMMNTPISTVSQRERVLWRAAGRVVDRAYRTGRVVCKCYNACYGEDGCIVSYSFANQIRCDQIRCASRPDCVGCFDHAECAR